MAKSKVIQKDADGWERIFFAEVLIPNTPNTWGDIYTEDAIREFAYEFAIKGLNSGVINDIDHDNIDVTGKLYVIESFIARPGDPDFIVGSWVVGMKVFDDAIWTKIVNNELNGFSYEAICGMRPINVENLQPRLRTGITAPDPIDGHTHVYTVVVDARNQPISGATGETDGHTHEIISHTVTGVTKGHSHRFDVLTQLEN